MYELIYTDNSRIFFNINFVQKTPKWIFFSRAFLCKQNNKNENYSHHNSLNDDDMEIS